MPKEEKDKPLIPPSAPVGKTQDELTAEETERAEAEGIKPRRAQKLADDQFPLNVLQENSSELFGVPSYVIDGALVYTEHDIKDTNKVYTKSEIKAAVEKFLKKEVTE